MSEIGHDLMLSLVVFSIAGQRYALNLPVVERVVCMVEVSPLPKAPVIVLGVINFHGQIIPAIDIRRRFGHSPSHYGLTSCLLVAQTRRRKLALPVDEILGVQEVPSENVTLPDAVLPGTGLVAGIAALSDGVLLIHDLDTFLSLDEEQRLTEALEGKAE
jgi:purine-binding chemotaxis protein CheW